jgi:hypothetical protein
MSTTVQDLIQGEINGFNDVGAAITACDVLAIWAHLQRFESETLNKQLVDEFYVKVRGSSWAVCNYALSQSEPVNWEGVMLQLDELWDHILDEDGRIDDEKVDQLEHQILEQFEALDRRSLLVYAISKLQPTLTDTDKFKVLENNLQQGEDFLAGKHAVYLSAARYASMLLDSYNPNLDEVNEDLFETTLKHRRLQELCDEQDYPTKHSVEQWSRHFGVNFST